MFQNIKEQLDLKEVVERYGVVLNNRNKGLCPFHNENTPSFCIKNQRYKCFGCGEGGDVINFVSKLLGLDNKNACMTLNDDFNLNLIESDISDQQSIANKRKLTFLRKEKQKQKRKQELAMNDYDVALKNYVNMQKLKDKYKPKKNKEISSGYAYALQKLPYYEYLVDIAEIKLKKVRCSNE